MVDIADKLSQTIKQAYDNGQALRIQGNNTKSYLAQDTEGEILSTLDHNGIIAYEPTELVITARTGTTIDEINAALSEHRQMLAFEPPQFNGQATLGGIVASGLSGPARPWVGAARDFILGSHIINGQGEALKFGGQVMKNVAGYDVSRLMSAAYGSLGLILDVSLKVLPQPQSIQTLSFEMTAEAAIQQMNQWSGQPLPISGACWYDGHLYLRLSGTDAGVKQAQQRLGGEGMDGNALWSSIRDFNHPVFMQNKPLWRLSLAPATNILPIDGDWLIDWAGAQRWLVTDEPDSHIMQTTLAQGGHYSQWHSTDKARLRTPLNETMLTLHKKLKTAFDPKLILNPGILYPDL